ncbi:uncharacterized protein LOC114583100 isoform X2 [Podarcis muralis]
MGVYKPQEIVHLILGSFYIVVLALIPSSDHFELNSALFVIGYVGQDVILPCQSSSGALPQNVEVQWKKTVDDNTENIYQFTAFTSQETFGQGYESRAVFATEGLDTGNVSLMLKMAKKSDEGSYSCIVKTKDWGAQTQTVLVVESSKGNSTSENYCSCTAFWVMFVFLLLALLALAVTVWAVIYKGAREKETLSRNEEQSAKEEKGEIKEEEEGLFPENRTLQEEKRTIKRKQKIAGGKRTTVLQENRKLQEEKVDVVFDPESAPSQPEVSRVRKSVSDTGNISKLFYYSDMLTLHTFIVAAHSFSEDK